MPILVGEFKKTAEANATARELVAAGVAPAAIRITRSKEKVIELTVSTDADNAEAVLRILKIRGSVNTSRRGTNWVEGESKRPADEVSGERRFVTENRDTSREPLENRDDVKLVDDGLDMERDPKAYEGLK